MKLFTNGVLFRSEFDSFLVKDGKFVKFGFADDLKKDYPDVQISDLGGAYVYPGFNDSHMHVLNYGNFLNSFSLAEHTSSIKELQSFLKENIPSLPKGSWIRGRGWNQDYFAEKRMLTREDLDEVSTEYPIYLTRACGHVAVLNSLAIRTLGLEEKQELEMGKYDPQTGLFEEFAVNLVEERLPKPDKNTLKRYLVSAMKKLNSYGITSCQSDDFETFSGIGYQEVLGAMKELEQEGKFTVRIYEQCQLPKSEILEAFLNEGCRDIASDVLKMGPLKLIADGSLGARTAYLNEPYTNDPSNKGICIYSKQELSALLKAAVEAGMDTAVHCIGDGALKMTLDCYEKLRKDHKDNYLGVVHVQVTDSESIQRIIDLKVVNYIQTIFLDYDSKIVDICLGKDRAETSYQFKTLYEKAFITANGSDCPVELPDVMKGIQCAVTRCSIGSTQPYLPQQALSVEQAIDSFTVKAAQMSHEEDIKGSLKEGQFADFTILSQDLCACDLFKIHQVSVLSTYLSGEEVFHKAN